jgi:hypothetical protein
MEQKTHKPFLYFLLILLIFGSFEYSVRQNEKAFISLEDGELLKLQIFARRKKTDLLFLGTSRTQDGVNPSLIAQLVASKKDSWIGVNSFNGAAAGGGLTRLNYSVNDIIHKPGLRYLGIELSDAQLANNEWHLPSSLRVGNKNTVPTIDERLQEWLENNVFLIKRRKSFILDNVVKLPFIIWPNFDDGTKWFGQVGGKYKSYPAPKNNQQWVLYKDNDRFSNISLNGPLLPGDKEYIPVYKHLVELAKENGVQVFFFTPPIRGDSARTGCDDTHIRTYQSIAKLTDSPLFIPSCEASSPIEYFSDDSHLNQEGKRLWSTQLAEDIAQSKL